MVNLRISTRRSRQCHHKKCKNIILFNIKHYSQSKYCYKHHNNIKLQHKIYELEDGFYKENYDHIIPKKKKCYSSSYLYKLIKITKKIIFYRKLLFQKNNMRNRRGHFSYHCIDIIFAYTYLLNILLNFKYKYNRFTIMNNGILLPIVKINNTNYLKYDINFYLNGYFHRANGGETFLDFNIINTFDSLEDFHSDLNIIPHQKDILKIKKKLEKYYWNLFLQNYKFELKNISLDSINIIKNYYDNNKIYDDTFNKVYLNKKVLNNDFLQNTVILTDRLKTKIYFFHK